MSTMRLGLLSVFALCCSVDPATAVPIATATFTNQSQGDALNADWCVGVTFDDVTFDVFGTPTNYGTQVGEMLCIGQTVDGVVSGHCEAVSDPNLLSFDVTAIGDCDGDVCSFVSESVTNVAGTEAMAVEYIYDGSQTVASALPATDITGCPLVGAVGRLNGQAGLNGFQPVATSPGSNVGVQADTTFFNPITGSEVPVTVDVDFAAVSSGGDTLVTIASSAAGALSANFAAAVDGFHAAFLDVTTTAAVTGPITICTSYDDEDDDGFIDGTGVPEDALTIQHGEGDPVTFVDRTASHDTVANVICAEVDSLSPFVTVPEASGWCPTSPVAGCTAATAGKAKLVLKDGMDATKPKKDKVLFKWKGDDINGSAVGDPVTDSSLNYALCVYDGSDTLILRSRVAGGEGWAPARDAFKFKDKTSAQSGAFKLLVKHAAGKAKALFKASGRASNLGNALAGAQGSDGADNYPDLPGVFPLPTPLRAQLVGSAGLCVEATLSDVKKNADGKYVGKN